MPVWLAEGRSDLSDNRSVWDWIKFNIRIHAVQHSKRKARAEEKKKKIYFKRNLPVQSKSFNQTLLMKTLSILIGLKTNWNFFYEEKLQGIIIRARARWCEYGEKSSKYFLYLEKRNHVKKHVRKLEISGSTTTDPLRILSEQKRLYQELYKSKNKNASNTQASESFLNNFKYPYTFR